MRTVTRLALSAARWIMWCLSTLANYVFVWQFEGMKKPLPKITNSLLQKSAVELASLIRQRKVRVEDVIQAFISRIADVHDAINALVVNRFSDALQEARQFDKILDSGNVPDELSEKNAPFLGVPFTAKEAFGVVGLPNTSGLICRKDVRAKTDADVVANMRRAGAIPIGLTNCSELCMWYESSNKIYGRTNNAYHHGRMVGGSSGGEGCLLSAAGSVIGVGSDIGGSIRMPAFFNGVFGHKTTTGIISNSGQHPSAKNEAQTFLSTGPMCRYASDLIPMFKVMARDTDLKKLKLDEKVDFKKLTVYYMEDDGANFMCSPVESEIKEAVRKVGDYFSSSYGVTSRKVHIDNLKYSLQIWAVKMSTSGDTSFCELMGDGQGTINPFLELLRWPLGFSDHTFPAIALGIIEKPRGSAQVEAKFRGMCDELKDEFHHLLEGNAVFVYPSHPVAAPYHNQPLLMFPNFSYTAIFNVLGLPITQVPMGLNSKGLPIGVQIVGDYHCDHITLAVALELEKAFGGWVAPA